MEEEGGMDPARKNPLRRKIVIGLCGVVVVWAIGCTVIYSEMKKPPEQFGHFMTKIPPPVAFLLFPFETMWLHARAGALNVGDRAPDFSLQPLHGGQRIHLSALNRQGPVVLVFGSYT